MQKKLTDSFVDHIFDMVHARQDSGFAAKMKKADNEGTEAQSWELLARWTDLENKRRTKCFALVGAAAARTRSPMNGELGLGRALWMSLEDKTEVDKSSAAARLRRILACQDSQELVRVLRSTLRFLESKEITLDFSRLLEELLWFDNETSHDRCRARWAMEFFGQKEAE